MPDGNRTAASPPPAAGRRKRLFSRYVTYLVPLVGGIVLASGAMEIYYSYRENEQALIALQQEKARLAAARIEQYIAAIVDDVAWTIVPPVADAEKRLGQQRLAYLTLLRKVPAITALTHVDRDGREQLRLSRVEPDVVGSGEDHRESRAFRAASDDSTYFGPVYFHAGSEPYMRLGVAAGGYPRHVTLADVNLKFIWDIVSGIDVGRGGAAFVVGAAGNLIAHPDLSLVLARTNVAHRARVRRAIAALGEETEKVPVPPAPQGAPREDSLADDPEVLSAVALIERIGWAVFVEQPRSVAFAPVWASLQRSGLVLLAGLALALIASIALARRLVVPIQTLEAGAARIGEGQLGHRIDVRTGDEIEGLATQLNRMAERLQDSYASLERRVEERTQELRETLEHQTATSEILRAISRSPNDSEPVFETILENATRLCNAPLGTLFLARQNGLEGVVSLGARPEFVAFLRDNRYPIDDNTVVGRAALCKIPVQVEDITAEAAYGDGNPLRVASADLEGIRTLLGVPLLRGDEVLGAIALYRRDVRPFDEQHVELVRTFADQAVIAIENVRLFQALDTRSRELAHSVAELEALGEVAQAVSSTLDLDTVLHTIVERAVELSGADAGAVHEFDAATGTLPPRVAPGMAELLELPAPRLGDGAVGRAAATRAPVQIPDITRPGAYTGPLMDSLLGWEIRALLAVPMVQGDGVLGTLVVARRTPGEFPPDTVRLLRALGSQSVLAIRNARLFREIEDKSRELEAANRHKSEFLANMSHELRTPLNAVIGFSEVLGERMFGELNEKQAEYVDDIHASGRHLLSLINDILDLSKIEAGAMELDVGRFALAPALDNALTLVKERAGRRGLALEARVGEDLGEIEADERKLKQILINLLSNAIKFTGEGGCVTLEATRDERSVRIAVHDTGVGIAAEDLEAIFEEFRQVGTDYARKAEGTGLGLALTKRFVELHGGVITVESEPGVGSVFRLSLPLSPPQTAARAAAQ